MWTPGLSCEVLFFFLCPGFLFGYALHPVLCAPCTEERLSLCPPVPASCPETAREPGCSCCHVCALQQGEACGVYSARCGQGLRCEAHPQEAKPIQALLNGQGSCLPDPDATGATEPEDVPTEESEMTLDHMFSYPGMFPTGQDKYGMWKTISSYEDMKAKKLSELKRWKEKGPCQKELYRALEKLARAQLENGGQINRFYLPNCNKNGFYNSKQCETSLDGSPAECWCVYLKSGRRIPGSLETRGEPDCERYPYSQE